MSDVEVAQTDTVYDTSYLTAVSANQSKTWSATVAVNGQELLFKLDTRAEVTVISDQAMKSLDRTAWAAELD